MPAPGQCPPGRSWLRQRRRPHRSQRAGLLPVPLRRLFSPPAAVDQGREGFEPGGDVQRSGTLGAMNFVAGNGNQVRPQGFGLEGNFQEALDGIRVKNGVGAEPVGELCI